jgi:hypothetical protein
VQRVTASFYESTTGSKTTDVAVSNVTGFSQGMYAILPDCVLAALNNSTGTETFLTSLSLLNATTVRAGCYYPEAFRTYSFPIKIFDLDPAAVKSVQRGVSAFTPALYVDDKDVAISSVDTSKAFVLHSVQGYCRGGGAGQMSVKEAQLTSSTNFRWSVLQGNPFTTFYCFYNVIELK